MGGVFVSYRRQDSQGSTGRIADRLNELLPDDVAVFVDIDSIRPGQDFRRVIADTLDRCAVTLVVIGPRWLTVADDTGRRRLDDPADLHRLEVESALRSASVTIPVLVEGASMPAAEDLPESIRDLAYRHAAEVSVRRFAADCEYLAEMVLTELASATAPADPPPAPPDPQPDPVPGPGPQPDPGPRPRFDRRWLVAAVPAAIAAAVVAVIVLTGGSGDDQPERTGGTEPATDGPTSTVVDGATSNVGVFDLGVGDCFDAVDTAAVVVDVPLVECDQPHDHEVYAIWSSFSSSLPADEDLLDGCETRFDEAIGFPYEFSIYWLSAFWPTEELWDEGRRDVVCYAHELDADGELVKRTGSVLDSGR